jgi:hypothetical protein
VTRNKISLALTGAEKPILLFFFGWSLTAVGISNFEKSKIFLDGWIAIQADCPHDCHNHPSWRSIFHLVVSLSERVNIVQR